LRKLFITIFIGIIITFAASWISSEKIKHDEATTKEKKVETVSKEIHIKTFDKYVGTWVGQDNNALHITVAQDTEKESYFTLTIAQQGTDTHVISLPIKEDGTGVFVDDKGVEYHVEFTKFYVNNGTKLDPAIEIYTYSDNSENASEQNQFIRAFKE
jgi:hypothetical protein